MRRCIEIFSLLLASAEALSLSDGKLSDGPSEKCFEKYGCYSNGPPFFDLIQRPIFPLPEDNIFTLFLLYNRNDNEKFKYLEPDENSLRNSGFDPSLNTKLIVHGYNYKIAEKNNNYLMEMKDTLLNLGDCNVIFVNWTQSASKVYPQAVANGRVVGAMIAELIQFLHDATGAPLKTMHLITHSLGSHVGGWAGERLNKLGRITALDVGGEYFYRAPSIVRLDPTDADFVDVLHTNAGDSYLEGAGRKKLTGHFDCYVNGGAFQPGCSIIGDLLPGVGYVDVCSHERSLQLFYASVTSTRKFICVACDSWEKYTKGLCDQRERYEMGYHAAKPKGDTTRQKFYVKTTGETPFWIP